MNMFNYFAHKIRSLKVLSTPYTYSFITGHSYLTDSQVAQIKNVMESGEQRSVRDHYEKSFSALIGNGYGISFAAGRMAFYVLMKALGIGKGDEVILPGFTCSVMVNAILRVGATPVFADIDAETFGSSAKEIEKKLTYRTKLIVAQHSFGIPCKIEEIVELGKRKGVFVVEDSALALDSSLKGVKVGNWGDAAIFSTEHSKPLNTLVGGFLYTKDMALYNKIHEISAPLPDLDNDHQFRLYSQFLFERKYYAPTKYRRAIFINIGRAIMKKLRRGDEKAIYFDDDYYNTIPNGKNYPYPAKLPSFLAQIGLFELERWPKESEQRKKLLKQYIDIMLGSRLRSFLPKAYLNKDLEIVPLRFVFASTEAEKIKRSLSKHLDTNLMLFNRPIVCCPDGPESLGYQYGACKAAEKACSAIINWPTVLPERYRADMLGILRKIAYS